MITNFTKGDAYGKELIVQVNDANTTISPWCNAQTVYTYTGVSGWSSNLSGSVAYNYFPNGNAPGIQAGDGVYVGYHADYFTTVGAFCGMLFNVGTALNLGGGSITFAIEGWKGSTWIALPAAVTNPFAAPGSMPVMFRPPAGFISANLNTTGAPGTPPSTSARFWVRLRVSAVTHGGTGDVGGANAAIITQVCTIRTVSSGGAPQNFGPLATGQIGVIKFVHDGFVYNETGRSIN